MAKGSYGIPRLGGWRSEVMTARALGWNAHGGVSPMGDYFFVAPGVMESPLPLGGETG